ncbi:hypothetical protein C8R45DRAFT_947932 [Mycena sanguinolenta]|nr:hypothetical protein C8R45DRAFT_947932 [Mycena sanguinolenta]
MLVYEALTYPFTVEASSLEVPFPRPPAPYLPPPAEVPFPRPPATYLPPPAFIYQSAIPPRVEFHPGNPIAPSFERPEPDRGTIPSMRDRSRLDNLPQHNSLRPGPSIRAPAVPVASGSSTTPNPFAVTTTVRPANANPGASSKEKKKRKKALKATKVVADTSEPVVSERKFFVLCMPFTHDDNEDLLLPSPPYEFRHEHIAALVETLELYNLTFELSLTVGAKNLWSTLDAAVRLHARKHKIIIPSTPADGSLHPYYTAADFSNAPWVPLQAKTSRKLKVLEPVEWVAYSYTEPALHKLAKSILNPKEEGVPLIFIAPTYGNLRGPLTVIDTGLVDDTPDAHRCFPYRVWYSLPWQDDVDAAVCFTPPGRCIEPVHFVPIQGSASRSRTRSLSVGSDSAALAHFEEPPTNRRRVTAPESPVLIKYFQPHIGRSGPSFDNDIVFPPVGSLISGGHFRSGTAQETFGVPSAPLPLIAGDNLSNDILLRNPHGLLFGGEEPTPDRKSPPLASPVHERVVNIPAPYSWEKATGVEVLAWISGIVSIAQGTTVPTLSISAPSLTAAARTLFSLIQHNGIIGSDFVPETGVDCPVVSDLGFVMANPSYTIQTPGPNALLGAQGEGPERSVHLKALELLTSEPTHWEEAGEFMRATFVALDTARSYVDGRYAAIAILRLEAGPMPISPFLIFAATQRSRAAMADLSLSWIHTLDPSLGKMLQPWFELESYDTVEDDPEHPAVILLSHFLDISPVWLELPRTSAEHRDMHTRLLERVLLGQSDVWQKPGFIQFQNGFCFPLAEHTLSEFAPPPTMGDQWSSSLTVMRYLLGLYDRQLQQPEDLISRLVVRIANSTEYPTTQQENLYTQLFIWRLWRWLNGLGYPKKLMGTIITDEEYSRNRWSPTLRAARFLYSLRETWTLPASPMARFSVWLHIDEVPSDIDEATTIFWHSCTNNVDIYCTPWVKNLLLEPGDLEDTSTAYEFDVWMSKMTALKGGDYNRL